MRIGKRKRALAVLLTIFCIANINISQSQTIEVCSNQAIAGSEVFLKDITKHPSTLPSGWGDRLVMRSPSPGKPIYLSLPTIAYALQKYPDMKDVMLRGKINLTLERKESTFTPHKITTAVEEFVALNEKWAQKEVHIKCETAKNIATPDQESKVTVTGFTAQKDPNRYLFDIEIDSNGTLTQTTSIYARVTPMIEVWMAKNPLARGQTIAVDDLDIHLIAGDTTKGLIPANELVTGLEVNRAVMANQPISRHFLVEPICAQRGDLVHVNASRNSLSVTLKAKALSTGRKDDRILCENEHSKRRLMVRLTGRREATIDF